MRDSLLTEVYQIIDCYVAIFSVCEIVQDVGRSGFDYHFQSQAIFTLQEAAEAYIVRFLDDTNLCTIHTKRKTITPKGMYLVQRMHRDYDLCWYWH